MFVLLPGQERSRIGEFSIHTLSPCLLCLLQEGMRPGSYPGCWFDAVLRMLLCHLHYIHLHGQGQSTRRNSSQKMH